MDLLESLKRYNPSSEQLEKINKLKPINQPDYALEELIVVPIAASNNLIHGSNGKWSLETLELITASYGQGGQDLLLDHTWGNSHNSMGMIFDAELWHYPTVDNAMMDYLLQKSNNEYDRKILMREGYYQVTLYAAVEDSHPIHSQLRYQRNSDVSIGGKANLDYYCPLCSTKTEMVKFRDERCPHYMPTQMFLAWYADDVPPEEKWRIAPYFIEHGWDSSVELSLVTAGDCKQARVINQQMVEVLC
ncbi:hypothetical protein [Crocosphaera sp.]|uniref:hypothetical protein n=1 Tax=Crocosphaera sp. TaxID=2729996 RepID=UPI00261D028D|nr:hypothetical protein [Crocosphaera sp.]MDJ0579091.1 hypothetical protein [Crocosphaera sp.]